MSNTITGSVDLAAMTGAAILHWTDMRGRMRGVCGEERHGPVSGLASSRALNLASNLLKYMDSRATSFVPPSGPGIASAGQAERTSDETAYCAAVRAVVAIVMAVLLSGCVAIPVGDPDSAATSSGQRAISVGLLPGIGGAWYAGGSVDDGRELSVGSFLAEAALWPLGVVLVNGVLLLTPTALSWYRLPSDGWDPPRYRDGREVCELSLIGACKTTRSSRHPPLLDASR
jgi:hypothetical protein